MSDLSLVAATTKNGLTAPKLKDDPSNWVLYKNRMTSLIEGHAGYRRHITGRALKPASLAGKDKADAEKIEAYENAVDEWMTKEAAIKSIILSSVSERHQVRLISSDPGEQTAKNMWDALTALFEDQNPVLLADLLGDLHALRTPGGRTVRPSPKIAIPRTTEPATEATMASTEQRPSGGRPRRRPRMNRTMQKRRTLRKSNVMHLRL